MTRFANPEARTYAMQHVGVEIIVLDFTGVEDQAEALAAIEAARRYVGRLTPDGSHLTLTDVRGSHYDRVITDALKRLATDNKPFIRAAAVVTDSRLHRSLLPLVALFSRRKLAAFDSREEALDYLVKEHSDRG